MSDNRQPSLKVGDYVLQPEIDRGYGQRVAYVAVIAREVGICYEGDAVITFVPRQWLRKLTPQERKARGL